MATLELKYSAYDKALPPQPIRMKVPGWPGSEQKMADGSEPEPWHCLPFTEAATYGLELLYQYDTECHVINDNGIIRFEWDFASETNSSVTGGEFVTFYPKPHSKFYLFNTSLDIQAPPGHVIATHTHPRFYTDFTDTVPLALCGHVQTEWWPKKFFVVFKVPSPGQRHIFRKGEPFVELRIVPQRARYELQPMDGIEEGRRREFERDILFANSEIATNVWKNPSGYAFNNHYKILAGAFSREGLKGVEAEVALATKAQRGELSHDASAADLLAMAFKRFIEKRYNEAKRLYVNVLQKEPENALAINRLGVITAIQGMPLLAIRLMKQATLLQPASVEYHNDLGELYRRLQRFEEAISTFQTALEIEPQNPQSLSNLGLSMAQSGRIEEGTAYGRQALQAAPEMPGPCFRMGMIYLSQQRVEEAISLFDAALERDPGYEEARRAKESAQNGKAAV